MILESCIQEEAIVSFNEVCSSVKKFTETREKIFSLSLPVRRSHFGEQVRTQVVKVFEFEIKGLQGLRLENNSLGE